MYRSFVLLVFGMGTVLFAPAHLAGRTQSSQVLSKPHGTFGLGLTEQEVATRLGKRQSEAIFATLPPMNTRWTFGIALMTALLGFIQSCAWYRLI